MAAQLIDAQKFKAAAAMPAEADDVLSLAAGSADKTRWPKFTFPTFAVTGATAAVSPDCSYRFLKKAIDAAQSTLLLYIYDVGAPYLLELLANAKARGVKIRAMYDVSMGTGPAELTALKKVVVPKGVRAAPSGLDRNVFTVCHQKFLVIDGNTVILESANWAKSAVPKIEVAGGFKKANREWFIQFDDAAVAGWFAALFEADWDIEQDAGAATGVAIIPPTDVAMLAAATKPGKIFDIQTIADPTAKVTPLVSPDNYLSAVKKLMKSATKSIYVQQQYILAGAGVKDLVQILAQKRADNPAFDIRVISSATFPKNWERTKATLESAGLLKTLKAINPNSFGHCHNKGVIVDGHTVVVSSTNWSTNSVTVAREAGVIVRSEKITRYYQDVFLLDWKEGLSIDDVATELTVLDGADIA